LPAEKGQVGEHKWGGVGWRKRLPLYADERPCSGVFKNRRPTFRDQADPALAEAAQWLARADLGTLDEAAFEQWRAADPRHALAFARMADAAQKATFAGQDGRAATHEFQVSRRAAVAAGLGVLALGGGALVAGKVSARDRATTPVGGTQRIVLPRAGDLILNTDSAASWRRDRQGLSLWLERGEAALDLTDGAGPVHLRGKRGGARLGPGRYNARLREDLLDLTILRGQAVVDETGGGEAIQKPSALLLGSGEPLVRVLSDQDIAETLAWRDGAILFVDEPLPAAVVEYNRHLVRKIIIADPRLKDLHVGGRFDADDPRGFLRALETAMDVQVSMSDREILLYRKRA
jgi:transmembrane sensor